MTGQAHWLPLAIVAAVALVVATFWLHDWFAARLYRVEQRCVRCRERGNKLVQLKVVYDVKSGEPIGVRECSGWAERGEAVCCRQCLPLFTHKAA